MPGGQSADRTCLHSNSFRQAADTPVGGPSEGEVLMGWNDVGFDRGSREVMRGCRLTDFWGKVKAGGPQRGDDGAKSVEEKEAANPVASQGTRWPAHVH